MAGAGGAPLLEVVVGSALWHRVPEVETTVRQAIDSAARLVRARPGELTVMLADDARVRELNRRFRGRDQATNVLAFATAPGPARFGQLGDIVIAFETAAAEASAEAKALPHHVAHLAVHGFLHLMGYQHEADQAAEVMEQLESRILSRLGIPDPYGSAIGSLGNG